MNIVDLFSGCGGLSQGAHMAGLTVSVGIETDPSAHSSFAANFPGANAIHARVELLDPTQLVIPNGEIVLCGGPPCQGFSSSNQRNRNISDSRNHLYKELIRYADILQPKAVIFENVYGIIEGRKRDILDSLIFALKKRFKTVDWCILNAADFGIPQIRRRVFVVATRKASSIVWPKPSSCSINVRDAFSDLPDLANGANVDILPYKSDPQHLYAQNLRSSLCRSSGHTVTNNDPEIVQRYRFIPEGGNWRDIPVTMMSTYSNRDRCHTGIFRRLSLDKPSVVIGNFRKNMLVHPFQDRGLSIREAARLQSFPDGFVFNGSIGKRQQQVGNAVPPQLAAEVIKSTLLV